MELLLFNDFRAMIFGNQEKQRRNRNEENNRQEHAQAVFCREDRLTNHAK